MWTTSSSQKWRKVRSTAKAINQPPPMCPLMHLLVQISQSYLQPYCKRLVPLIFATNNATSKLFSCSIAHLKRSIFALRKVQNKRKIVFNTLYGVFSRYFECIMIFLCYFRAHLLLLFKILNRKIGRMGNSK